MSSPFISAIICTHNRGGYLGVAIDSLLQQTYHSYEVIVIDNASTDDTREVVEAHLANDCLHYVYEDKLGLSFARNRGAEEAQGEILAYLDDDAEASPHWLTALAKGLQAHPQAVIAGGPVTLTWPEQITPPDWLSLELSTSLGAYNLGTMLHKIRDARRTPRGLNYAIKKSFLQSVGGFNTQLGRVGDNLRSNEELHMTQQALESGVEVLYLPEAQVAHRVAPERISPAWFLRRSWWQGVSECHREQVSHSLTSKRLRNRALGSVRGCFKALRRWYDPAQRFENLVYAYGQLGYLWCGVGYWIGRSSSLVDPNERL